MAELPPEKKRAFDAINESLQRMALKVLESPRSERDAVYEDIRGSLADARRTLNIDDKNTDFEELYMKWLRALVAKNERGGGAQGGKA